MENANIPTQMKASSGAAAPLPVCQTLHANYGDAVLFYRKGATPIAATVTALVDGAVHTSAGKITNPAQCLILAPEEEVPEVLAMALDELAQWRPDAHAKFVVTREGTADAPYFTIANRETFEKLISRQTVHIERPLLCNSGSSFTDGNPEDCWCNELCFYIGDTHFDIDTSEFPLP